MTPLSPWHSVNSDVYHDCSNCKLGMEHIRDENKRRGDGGRERRCAVCERLRETGRC